MAKFKITPPGSIVTSAPGVHAFSADTPDADTLVVDPGAFLIATGIVARGALLAGTKAWKVTVDGSIVSADSEGINLAAGNAGVSNIIVGAQGSVGGGSIGIVLKSAATVANAGVVAGGAWGISMDGGGTHAIKNTGTIAGAVASIIDFDGLSDDKVTNSGTLDGNVRLDGGNDTLTNSGSISGIVDLGTGRNVLTNSGTIDGNVFFDTGDGRLINSGTIDGNIVFDVGKNVLTNAGLIKGDVVGAAGGDTVTNQQSKSIGGDVSLGAGNDTVTNAGAIGTEVNLGPGDDTLTNSGTIGRGVFAGDGKDTVRNTGAAFDNVDLGGGDDRLINSGTIARDVFGGAGNDTVTNANSIAGNVSLGEGDNTLTNSGTIGGRIVGGTGRDTVTNTGIVFGFIDLGEGNDRFIGGDVAATVRDSDGADVYKLGGGNDTYVATGHTGADGNDTIDGGAGSDTYDASSAGASVRLNLDTVAHDFSPAVAAAGKIAAGTAFGLDVSGSTTNAVKDRVIGFENARTGSGDDVLHGSAAANVLEGGGGEDELFGHGGDDVLIGGASDDHLTGGAGRDMLSGGNGFDVFHFTAASDSGVTAATRDVITDFQDGADRIDLMLIDADSTVAGNQAFTYINGNSGTTPGAAFTGNAGELRSYWTATGHIIEGDINGDGKAEFSIELFDPAHSIVLTSIDFML